MPTETVTATPEAPNETPDAAVAEATAGLDEPSSEEPSGGWMDALDAALDATPEEDLGGGEGESAEGAGPDAGKPDEGKPDDKEVESEGEKTEEEAEDDAAVKNMTESAGLAFKAIKAEKKAAIQRAEAAEAKLREAEESPKPDAEEISKLTKALEEREAKLAEIEKELSVSRFEATDEYKESVLQPMAGILGVVERLAKKYEVPEKRLLNLLEENDPDAQGEAITEVAGEFSERDRVSLYTLADDYSEVIAHREDLRAKSSEALAAREKLQVSEAEKAKEAASREWDAATKKVWGVLKEKIPLPEDEGERTKLEADVVAQVSGAKFDDQTPEVKAFAGYSAALIPHVVKQNKALASELAQVKAALTKYQSATPGAGSGDQRTGTQEIPEGVSFLDAIDAGFSS